MTPDIARKLIVVVAALLLPGGLIALVVGWMVRRYAPRFSRAARDPISAMRARLTPKLGRVSLLQGHSVT